MKRVVLAGLFFLALSIFSSVAFCENYLDFTSRVPDKPYFMVGDIIYREKFASENSQAGVYYACYRYIGLSDKGVSLRCEYKADDDLTIPQPDDRELIIVPLDKHEKGYLSTYELPKEPRESQVTPVKLVIGIYDRNQALITVNEYGLKYIPQRSGSTGYKTTNSMISGTKKKAQESPESYGYGKTKSY